MHRMVCLGHPWGELVAELGHEVKSADWATNFETGEVENFGSCFLDGTICSNSNGLKKERAGGAP